MDKSIIIKVLLSVLAISVGQVFLKLSALSVGPGQLFGVKLGKYLFINIYLIIGIAVLGGGTLLWVWVLRTIPLSTAYPFMALAFVLVPAFSYFILDEAVSWGHILGFLLIIAGVVVVSRQ